MEEENGARNSRLQYFPINNNSKALEIFRRNARELKSESICGQTCLLAGDQFTPSRAFLSFSLTHLFTRGKTEIVCDL